MRTSPSSTPYLKATCQRNSSETIEYVHFHSQCGTAIRRTRDGGQSWDTLPWKASFYIRALVALQNFSWPPCACAIGWHGGKVVLAVPSTVDTEIHIGKFVATFNDAKQMWTMECLGAYNLSDQGGTGWYRHAGFDPIALVIAAPADLN